VENFAQTHIICMRTGQWKWNENGSCDWSEDKPNYIKLLTGHLEDLIKVNPEAVAWLESLDKNKKKKYDVC